MNTIGVPFEKIEYINYSNEIYEKNSYHRMTLELSCSKELRASLSFYWKEDDRVPVELLELINTMGIDVNVSDK